MKSLIIRFLIIVLGTTTLLMSCTKSNQNPSGLIALNVEHVVDNNPLEVNKLKYVNASGNPYLITEVQWFISRIQLITPDGSAVELNKGEAVYFDTGIPASLSQIIEKVPVGTYSGLRFTFGLDEEMNKSLRYTNPPESFMFWPDYLGGGYHYMKLNGKWLNNNGLLEPFNFHLGIGQIYDSAAPKSTWTNLNDCCKSAGHCEGYQPPAKTMPVKGFVQNYFEVSLPVSFTIEENKQQALVLRMNIDEWFKSPHNYDHNVWGGSIMQQQAAMKMGCENGRNAFTIVNPSAR
ncbi:MAG TPA: hypothetical protein PKE03_04060 [Bacteroidales bacterium]|nr:hypothetical protein [Bacteroidales bacterium]